MANPNLSLDLIFEILTRISSSQALARSRLVCKDWNQMTYKSSFIDRHCQRTNTISGYFVQTLESDIYSSVLVSPHPDPGLSFDFLPTDGQLKIEASSSQGLLFCKCQDTKIHFLCKPSTKQWRYVLNSEQKFTESTALMVLRWKPLRFLIIKLSMPIYQYYPIGSPYYREAEIYDSDQGYWTYHWNNIEFPSDEVLNGSPPVVAGGAAHWLTNKKNVIRFSEEQQTWKVIPPPQAVADAAAADDDDFEIVNCVGKLGLIWRKREEGIRGIWVLGKELWEERSLDECEDGVMVRFRGNHENGETVFPFKSDFETFCLSYCHFV